MQVFLSYSWNNSEAADRVERMCRAVGIRLIRDKYDLRYAESIVEFADKIDQCDFVVCLVSEDYVKSRRCMYEAAILMQSSDYFQKICCVVVSPLKTDVLGRVELINFWNEKISEIEAKKREVDRVVRKSINEDLEAFKMIKNCVYNFIRYVDDNKYVTDEDIQKGGISVFIDTVVSRIGIDPQIHLKLLSQIAENDDLMWQEKELDNYSRTYRKNEYYYFVRAYIYEQHGYNELALTYYKLSVGTSPKYVIGYEAIINMLLSNNDTDMCEVKFYLDKLVSIDPALSCIDRIKGEMAMCAADYKGAIENYSKYVEKEPTDYAVYNSIGIAYSQSLLEEDIQLARKNFDKAIEINPDYYQCYNNLAIWYFKFEKDYKEAVRLSDKCLSIKEDYYYSYNVRGLAYIELGEYEKAFDDLCTSIILSPKEHPLPMTNIGYLIEKGFADYDVSKLFYKALVKQGDINAEVALANQLFRVDGEVDDAMKIADNILKKSPNNLLMWFLKAMIDFEKKEFLTAYNMCNECIKLEDTYWPAYFLQLYIGYVCEKEEVVVNILEYKDIPEKIRERIEECFKKIHRVNIDGNYKYMYEYIRKNYNYLSKATVQRKNYIKLQNGMEEFAKEITPHSPVRS